MTAPHRQALRWTTVHAATLLDVALGAAVAAGALVEIAGGVLTPAWLWTVVGLLSGVAVATLRRRQPLLLLAALLVLHAALPAGPRTEPPFYFFMALVTAFSLGAYVRRRTAVLALATLVVSYVAYTLRSQSPMTDSEDALAGSLFICVFAMMGLVFAASRRRAERLQSSAASLLVEQEGHARAAVEEERTRIARELHDAVAHDVSVMTLQIGALRHRLHEDQQREREVLGQLERAGREAVDDLRRIVGILRRREGADRSPRPSMAHLERLVERIRDAGLPVELEEIGDSGHLPPGIDASAYRIVQEALTNVLRHAPGAPTLVRVEHSAHELRINVTNGRSPGRAAAESDGEPGHGLIGMRERVALFGGELHAGAAQDAGFTVRASFPLGRAPSLVEGPAR